MHYYLFVCTDSLRPTLYHSSSAHADAQGELVSAFSSRDDLINCLLTSCQIPVYFDGKFGRPFRGHLSFDGGATNFLPSPPVEYTARVCCFPSRRISIVRSLCMFVAAALLNDSLNLARGQVCLSYPGIQHSAIPCALFKCGLHPGPHVHCLSLASCH